jgi:DNA (cytosine-5)-methyltransferase 1
MKKTDLLESAGIYSQTLAKMGKNEAISMDTLEKICAALNCRIEDIVEFVPDHQEQK